MSWAGSTLRLMCQFTICQKNRGLLFHPQGSLFSYTWVHVEQHEADWDKLVTPPKSSPGNIRTDSGLKHHQDVRVTDPFKLKGWALLSLQEYQVRRYWGNSLQGSLKWQHLEDSKILQRFIRVYSLLSGRSEQWKAALGFQNIKSKELKAVATSVQGQMQTCYPCSHQESTDKLLTTKRTATKGQLLHTS